MRKVVFVSYYTPNYKEWADVLRHSLEVHKLDYDLVPITEPWDWQRAVRYKPQFLLDMLRKHADAYAVVWIDADGKVVSEPELFFRLREDIAVHFLEWKNKAKEELLSGTVYLANRPKVIQLMETWIEALAWAKEFREAQKLGPLTKPEQMILQSLLEQWKCIPPNSYVQAPHVTKSTPRVPRIAVSVKRLPGQYCQITDGRQYGGVTVIEHGQASRLWRYGARSRKRRRAAKKYEAPRRERKPPRPKSTTESVEPRRRRGRRRLTARERRLKGMK